MPGVLRPSWDARALSAGGCCMQGEVLVPGASNMVATAEDCCQACWMYSGQPGRGNGTAAGQHALPAHRVPCYQPRFTMQFTSISSWHLALRRQSNHGQRRSCEHHVCADMACRKSDAVQEAQGTPWRG